MNLRLEKLESRFVKGIFKNKPKSITIRNGTIRYSEKLLITEICPRSKPTPTATAIINV
ncbi:hypothetical protein [Salegentibacter mishustinae]|jgi:hypothetical protein|uniref:hypothetical protein n=1 Tax=Salegentibacter mishustinae TaxID=270918 RepID=UPI0024920B0B|nr:hypothetical protein [Salegentibacter mishustinae]|tara:strand:- start:730 stop:906 length:177 start_codon:yes stop_codon:yes gene_type:complete